MENFPGFQKYDAKHWAYDNKNLGHIFTEYSSSQSAPTNLVCDPEKNRVQNLGCKKRLQK